MIKEIEIENFRSIRNDTISFDPITVLIGANGSGKSNLVKLLGLISDIPKFGIQIATSRQGGRDSIVPKIIPLKEAKNTYTRVKYRVSLPSPMSKSSDIPRSVDTIHQIVFLFNRRNSLKIEEESIVFEKVLFIGKILGLENKNPIQNDELSEEYEKPSIFSLYHKSGKVDYKMIPEAEDSTVPQYLRWLGFSGFQDKISTKRELEVFLNEFIRGRTRRYMGSGSSKVDFTKVSFLEEDVPTIIDFSPNLNRFQSEVGSIKRYDFLQNILRREQAPSESEDLSQIGENMPAAFRSLGRIAKSRLQNSFESIAPHIFQINTSTLRTGQEFLEFIESRKGRKVESWESSDGSLRALAILVALESSEYGDILIIEEPEQNLHPWAIRTLMNHMREVAEERSLQLILTTHSEHVLEVVEPEEVRVVTRTAKEGTKINRIEQIFPNSNIQMGDVGRLWVKGLLGGVPTFD